MQTNHYVVIDGEAKGPFTISQLQSMWKTGILNLKTQHFMDGYTEWMPIEHILEDLEPKTTVTHKIPYQPAPAYPSRRVRATNAGVVTVHIPKSRGIYIILGIFLGLLGVHNLYAGRFGSGVAQLLIAVLTGWLILPLFAVGLWVLIDLILVDRDGNGKPMS